MTLFQVRDHQGTPTLFQNGQPTVAAIYLTVRNSPPRREGWQGEPYMAQFRDAGFHFYSIPAPVAFDDAYDPATGSFPEDRLAPLDILSRYGEVDPQAKLLLRVTIEPRGNDSPWLQQHPDECEIMEARAKGIYHTPSYASQLWLRDGCAFLRAFIRYLYDHDLDRYILGYLVCGGDSSEWVKVGPMEDWASDYSQPMQEAFRRWLGEKYGHNVPALREAWADPLVDFSQDLVPSPEEQGASDLFLFKDPHRRRRAIDHFQCLAHVVATDIDTLCATAKEACHGEHLAGVFYGYLQEIVWNNGFFGQRLPDADVAHTAAARSGHAGLPEVLRSPHVDFLSSPYSYGYRWVGGEGGFMSPEASVRRAGKLWISEEDTRTHLWRPDSLYGQTRNTRETVEVLKRQLANILTHGGGAWWCDWSYQEGGAYAEPEVMAVFQRYLELAHQHLTLPDRSSAAEIAVVFDAESSFYRSTLNNYDIPNWRQRAWGYARMGAPYDGVLLSDILEGRSREYKLYILGDAFHLSAAQRQALKSILRRDNKMALWIYAPGFVDEDLSAEHCHDLTGIRLRQTDRQWSANLYLTNFQHPITRNLPTSTTWGTDMRLGPLFTVSDPDVTVLGTVVINQGRCEPGFVLKQEADWASFYSAAPNLPPGLLREVARYAAVHIYTDHDDVFYADHAYVALHTVRGELKTVRLPHPADVWEVFSNRQVATASAEFQDAMDAGATHLYYCGPDQAI
jgi:hypothetical protein